MAEPGLSDCPLPRQRTVFIGHREAERAFAEAVASGRLHHAWLIGGEVGIGKATLAYRFARFLLAHGRGSSRPLLDGGSLAVDPAHPAARQVSALSHPNLLVLDPELLGTDKGPARSISVEAVRRVISFFGSTSIDGGYRICVIDSAEDLTHASANALLKAIEEPPTRSVFLIVSHAPQRVMATIRSRCRKLTLRPLGHDDLRHVIGSLGPDWADIPEDRVTRAIDLGEGSVRRTVEMLDPLRIAVVDEVSRLLDSLPNLDTARVLGLAERLAGKQGEDAMALTLDTVQGWLSAAVERRLPSGAARLAPLAEVCEKLGRTAATVDVYNLDRRPFVVSLFGDLAEAVRQADQR